MLTSIQIRVPPAPLSAEVNTRQFALFDTTRSKFVKDNYLNPAAMTAERSFSSNLAEPLAIVGLSFKLPQDAVDEASLWKILEQRRSLLTDWPSDRACVDGFYKEGLKEPNMVPNN